MTPVPPDLAVIVPTLDEAGNVARLVDLLEAALAGIAWEVVFVDDDSADGTADIVHALGRTRPNVRCLKRIGRRGLSSAVIEGMMATAAPYLAVMDADLQHDETLLPRMLDRLRQGDVEIVVASRFAAGSTRDRFSAARERLSGLGNRLARLVSRTDGLSDPLSGFFMLRRPLIEEVAPALNGQGFKILLDIFASAKRPVAAVELPFAFRDRHAGHSKLDATVKIEYLVLILDKLLGGAVPARFILFVLVGLTGLAVHLAVLGLLLNAAAMPFWWAQGTATLVAMTSNFWLNNRVTFRDRQLGGRALWSGLLSFYAVCAVGALINVQMAEFFYERGLHWALAGFIGAALSSVWNFGVTTTVTWRRRRSARGR
jgi:dolichol-phosphate mannosyltransferase